MAPPWADEFPNDNPDLFIASEHPPPIPDDDVQIELIDAFDEADFAHAVTESMLPAPPDSMFPSPDEAITESIAQAPSAAHAEVEIIPKSAPLPETHEEDQQAWKTFIEVIK